MDGLVVLDSRFVAMVGGVGAFVYAKRDIDKKRIIKMREEAKEASKTWMSIEVHLCERKQWYSCCNTLCGMRICSTISCYNAEEYNTVPYEVSHFNEFKCIGKHGSDLKPLALWSWMIENVILLVVNRIYFLIYRYF